MAAITSNKSRSVRHTQLGVYKVPVAASTNLYQGAFVGDNGSGYARNLVANDPFIGINAANQADNSSGAAGDLKAEIVGEGILSGVTVAGASGVGDVGKDVYCSSNNDLTLTALNNSKMGKILAYNSESATFDLYFMGRSFRDVTNT